MSDKQPITIKDWLCLVGILLFGCVQAIIIWAVVTEISSGRMHRDFFGPHDDCYQCDKTRRNE